MKFTHSIGLSKLRFALPLRLSRSGLVSSGAAAAAPSQGWDANTSARGPVMQLSGNCCQRWQAPSLNDGCLKLPRRQNRDIRDGPQSASRALAATIHGPPVAGLQQGCQRRDSTVSCLCRPAAIAHCQVPQRACDSRTYMLSPLLMAAHAAHAALQHAGEGADGTDLHNSRPHCTALRAREIR